MGAPRLRWGVENSTGMHRWFMSMCSKPLEADVNRKMSGLARERSLVRIVYESQLVGAAFAVFTIAVLYGIEFIDSLEHGWRFAWRYVNHTWIYEQGGFPCIGVFAIASASYFISKQLNIRFVVALFGVAIATWLLDVILIVSKLAPRMGKSENVIHWQRPTFICWLTLPPWLLAVAFIVYLRTRHRRNNELSPSDSQR